MTTANPSSRRVPPRRRGSAMIEFMITTALFIVPVMLYASYISEALWASLKAEEAAGAAAWSFSGRLLHDYDSWNHSAKYSSAASSVQSEINTMYQGLQPWEVAVNGSHPAQLTGIAAKSSMTNITCQAVTNNNVIDPSDPKQFPLLGYMPPMGTLSSKLHAGGLISCNSTVQVQNWLFGHSTPNPSVKLGGFGNLWPSNVLGAIQVCGVGSPKSGSCQNTGRNFTMYTDDWGLAEDGNSNGKDDWTVYQDYGGSLNKHFADVGQQVYENEALPVPYDKLVQVAEAALPLMSCPYAVADKSLFDKQYLGSGRGNYNLAYRRASETPWSGSSVPIALSRDDPSPENSYEGGIQQPSYTWPVRHWNTGPIKRNAYMHLERNRTTKYLSQ